MKVEIVKTFNLSRDGITPERMETGSVVDIPDRLAPGLLREGYVKAVGASRENKMMPPVETMYPVEQSGEGHQVWNLPSSERLDAELVAEATALGVRVDRRWSAARLRAEIDKARG